MRELAHRIKNGFALVQAIARQTFSHSDPVGGTMQDMDDMNSTEQMLAAVATPNFFPLALLNRKFAKTKSVAASC
ncbi:hypothetical protein ABID21_004593 [Pseudorhizobium tarimense]|uniref:histidine kinase n=1 Tax=Pseudorhizobium tarimense TaxID=1079109 RepID=A0ABV2HE23_9HYPH